MKKDSNKYIILKDGYNIPLIIGCLLVVVLVGILATSRMWLPDDRSIVKKNNDQLLLMMNTVTVNDFYVDYESQLAELHLREKVSSSSEQYQVTYTVRDENNNELPFNVIRGNQQKANVNDVGYTQDVIVQFAVPKGFYYVNVNVEQPANGIYEILLDYRNFKEMDLIEKGNDYLVNYENEVEKLDEYSNEIDELKETIKKLKQLINELEKIDDSSFSEEEKAENETNLSTYRKQLTDSESKLKQAEANYESQKLRVDQYDIIDETSEENSSDNS